MPVARPFPHRNIAGIYRTCIEWLRADPGLRPTVRCWQTFSGAPNDVRDVSADDLPWLRITPGFGAWRWADETGFGCRMSLQHEFGVAGTDVTNLMSFYELIVLAWSGQGTNELLDKLLRYRDWQITPTGMVQQIRLFGQATGLAGSFVITLDFDLLAANCPYGVDVPITPELPP